MITFEYNGPVCPVNQRYANRAYNLSRRYSDAKTGLTLAARKAMRGKKVLLGGVALTIEYWHRECDCDCFIKFIMDALEHVVFENDKQVQELTVKKHKGPTRMIISIYDLNNYNNLMAEAEKL